MTKNRIREDAFKMSGSMGTDAIDYVWPQIEDFAKQESIAFAKWMEDEKYYILNEHRKYITVKYDFNPDVSEDELIHKLKTLEQLYSLYQQSKNKQP